ncbi:MAG: PilZ domain-containing protein [Isosphaeraceae bacterium]|nr:PilZ domain-containing protein [Isosphaeraceae bacterium]
MHEDVADRRAAVREAVVANRVCVEWWADDHICRTDGRMLDISQGGTLVAADVVPPLGQPVWFHVETPARTDEVGARVVRHGKTNEIGLSFAHPCPYDLYLTATLGINPCGMLVTH